MNDERLIGGLSMEFTDVIQHMNIMLISLGFGAMIALLFDSARFFLKLLKFGSVVQSIFEVIFWILAAISAFNIYFTNYWGEIRFYNLAIILLGFYLYKLIFSKKIINIFLFAKRIINNIFNICLYPLFWLKQK